MFQMNTNLIIDNINDQFLDNNTKIKDYIVQLEDKNWILGECPNFSNNIDFKFDWGYVDVYYEVEKGQLTKVKVYSDSLYTSAIETVQDFLN